MALYPLEEGEIFADRYRIVRCIASGGMGAVYEAVHTHTERRCALKVMLGHTVKREQLRKRFMQESKVAAQIGSEFIVDVLDAGVDEKTEAPFLVMELLEGEDLGRRLLRVGRFSPEETVIYLWQAALALDRTHQANIVHRDLKASNLFLTAREDGTPLVKVLDFGVAKVMPLEATSEGATQTVGTPIYMSPEQFRARGRVSPATDIYALGMLAYTLLVGVHYWKEEHDTCENPFAFANIAVHGPKDPPSVRAARQGVTLSQAFDAWFRIATSVTPNDRFASASQAVNELSNALGVAPPASSPSHVPPALESMPIAPASVPPMAALPETVESASARLSGIDSFADAPDPVTPLSGHSVGTPISSVSSGTGMPIPTGPSHPSLPHTIESGVEEILADHTEVSLSVTSGGLGLTDAGPSPGPAKRRSALAAGLTVVVVAGVGLTGAWWSTREAPQTVIEPRKLETMPASKKSREKEPSVVPPKAADEPDNRVEVTKIADLPAAAAETTPPARPPPPRRKPASRRPTTAAQAPKAADPPPPSEDTSSAQKALERPKKKPINRESLYSRD